MCASRSVSTALDAERGAHVEAVRPRLHEPRGDERRRPHADAPRHPHVGIERARASSRSAAGRRSHHASTSAPDTAPAARARRGSVTSSPDARGRDRSLSAPRCAGRTVAIAISSVSARWAIVSRTSQPHAGVGRNHVVGVEVARRRRGSDVLLGVEVVEQRVRLERRRHRGATGAADARAPDRHRDLGRVRQRRRARRERGRRMYFATSLVDVVAEHLAQLGLHRLVHGLARGERLGRLRAPPRELLAALAPAVAAELGEHRRDRAVVFLVASMRAQRQLPAHRRAWSR